jgi:tRNA (guanine37-N1)-methyltransferase
MKFNVLTIFPELISHYAGETILGRAQKKNIISVHPIFLRDFAEGRHRKVDDTPYGGGAGMVMKPEPIYKALQSIDAIPFKKTTGLTRLKKVFNPKKTKKRTVLLSPRGRQFTQRVAEDWATLSEITFICGRYEGVDQRVVDHMIDEEISVGPYVLAGGELGALIMIEAVSRLLPGVLGNPESLSEETFGAASVETGVLGRSEVKHDDAEYPQYTKPADFMGHKVPEVLQNGDHKKIVAWRESQSKKV